MSGGNQVSVINIGSTTTGPTWESDSLIFGVRVSDDGTILYVATEDEIQGRDPRTGTSLGAIQLPGVTDVLDVAGP